MKVFCSNCGIHFKEEFEESLTCGWWDRWEKLDNYLSTEVKKKIWDWLFLAPVDIVKTDTEGKLHLDIRFGLREVSDQELQVDHYFEEAMKGMNEEERKAFQKKQMMKLMKKMEKVNAKEKTVIDKDGTVTQLVKEDK